MRREYPERTTSVLVWLVATMIAAFVLQLVLLSPWFGASARIPNFLVLSVRGMQQGHVWTLLTYGFLHSTGNPLHIVFSLLSMIFIGRELEPQLGGRKFLVVFGGALLVGALCWLALNWRFGGVYFGPGPAIMGLLVVLACLYPNQPMTFMIFFLIPVTMRPIYFIYALGAIDGFLLLLYELPGASTPFSYAPSAHLGGMLAGWLFFRYLHANNGWDRATGFTLPSWLRFKKNIPQASSTPASPRRGEHPAGLRADVDRILDKINSHGFGSLSEEEKRTLDAAKDLLGKP